MEDNQYSKLKTVRLIKNVVVYCMEYSLLVIRYTLVTGTCPAKIVV